MKRKCLLPLLLLLMLVLLTACGGKNDIKYAEELSELTSDLTNALAAFDVAELEDPLSVAAITTAIDVAVPICNQIIELEAPSRFSEIHGDFSQGAECYRDGLLQYREMLQLLNVEETTEEIEEMYVTYSMAGSELLMEGAEHFQTAFEKLKDELE